MQTHDVDPRQPGNPWRTGVLLTVVLIAVLGIAGAVVAGFAHVSGRSSRGEVVPAAAARPSRALSESECNQYAVETSRDTGRIVKDGVVGGAVGAGVGAAGGAIVDRHHSVGKGAGIGALVGAAAGTLHGLSAENRKSEEAKAAYGECMARHGY
jgi:YmgG-like glycine-zipper protein